MPKRMIVAKLDPTPIDIAPLRYKPEPLDPVPQTDMAPVEPPSDLT
jgi:hypothetical protein